jgi:hypothetical protein
VCLVHGGELLRPLQQRRGPGPGRGCDHPLGRGAHQRRLGLAVLAVLALERGEQLATQPGAPQPRKQRLLLVGDVTPQRVGQKIDHLVDPLDVLGGAISAGQGAAGGQELLQPLALARVGPFQHCACTEQSDPRFSCGHCGRISRTCADVQLTRV